MLKMIFSVFVMVALQHSANAFVITKSTPKQNVVQKAAQQKSSGKVYMGQIMKGKK